MESDNLYLIAHKVRGERAFDVAVQMDCPKCMDLAGCNYGCAQCNHLGYWWVIPTSGHRAYPFAYSQLEYVTKAFVDVAALYDISDLRDHYEVSATSPRRDYTNRAPSKPVIPNLEDI